MTSPIYRAVSLATVNCLWSAVQSYMGGTFLRTNHSNINRIIKTIVFILAILTIEPAHPQFCFPLHIANCFVFLSSTSFDATNADGFRSLRFKGKASQYITYGMRREQLKLPPNSVWDVRFFSPETMRFSNLLFARAVGNNASGMLCLLLAVDHIAHDAYCHVEQ